MAAYDEIVNIEIILLELIKSAERRITFFPRNKDNKIILI